MLAQNLHARVRAALPPEVPVLLPAQAREPLDAAPLDDQGRPTLGGGERGLGLYLKQHPLGFVQVRHGDGFGADNPVQLGLIYLDVYAPTYAAADQIASAAQRAAQNLQVRPTPFTFSTRQTLEQDAFTRLVLTFETRELGV